MIGLTYHKDYDRYDLGLNHPLIGDKPKKTMEFFKSKSILEKVKTFTPDLAKYEDIIRAHDTEYVERVKNLSKTGGELSKDTPAPKGIYEIALRAVGGSILGSKKLMDNYKIMCNPLGGFHHASKDKSSGFCFFNDIAISIEYLREKYDLKKFAVIDLDVHHGNGTQDIYLEDPSVLNISFHQDGKTLYVCESAFNRILKYQVEPDGALSEKSVLVDLPGGDPDGMNLDIEGNIIVAHFGGGAIYKISPVGGILEKIPTPGQKPSNVEFAGPDLKTLYITEDETNAIYKTRVEVPGLLIPPK